MERSLSLSLKGPVALLGMCGIQLKSSIFEGFFIIIIQKLLLKNKVHFNLLNGHNLSSFPVSHKFPQKDTARAGIILASTFCKNKHCGETLQTPLPVS